MSSAGRGGPPAGWYPDPTGGPHPRWWDGIAWTNVVRSPDTGKPIRDQHFKREDAGTKFVRVLLIVCGVFVGLGVLLVGACIAALSSAY